mmetsp:Transcript_8762/g.21642  ORF Transcript_8762/g.21642 Transcript_8762/m.21642 type:complete len:242 (-) Transcript_8762:178-903(-)
MFTTLACNICSKLFILILSTSPSSSWTEYRCEVSSYAFTLPGFPLWCFAPCKPRTRTRVPMGRRSGRSRRVRLPRLPPPMPSIPENIAAISGGRPCIPPLNSWKMPPGICPMPGPPLWNWKDTPPGMPPIPPPMPCTPSLPNNTENGSFPPKNCEKIASACSLETPPLMPEELRPDLPNWSYVCRFSLLLSTSYASQTFLKFSSACSLLSGFLSGWNLMASFLYALLISCSVAPRGTPSNL